MKECSEFHTCFDNYGSFERRFFLCIDYSDQTIGVLMQEKYVLIYNLVS